MRRRRGASARTAAASSRHVLIDPIRDDEGKHIGFAKITRDITEQRRARRGAGRGARLALPGAEAAGDRRADRRHRPRFQQSDDGDPRLGRIAAQRRPPREQAPALSRRDHRDRRPRRDAHQPPARLRPPPAAQARSDRPQPAPRRLCRNAVAHARRPDRDRARSRAGPVADLRRFDPARNRPAQRRDQCPRRDGRRAAG